MSKFKEMSRSGISINLVPLILNIFSKKKKNIVYCKRFNLAPTFIKSVLPPHEPLHLTPKARGIEVNKLPYYVLLC